MSTLWPPPPEHQWIPRSEAARRLSISERTLDRRLRQGTLERRFDEHNRILVAVPIQTAPPAAVPVDGPERDGALLDRLLAQQEALTLAHLSIAALLAYVQDLETRDGAGPEAALPHERLQLADGTGPDGAGPSWWRRLLASIHLGG